MNLRPDDFWRLSVEEWRWLNAAGASEAPSRAEIDALVAQYPDEIASSSFSPSGRRWPGGPDEGEERSVCFTRASSPSPGNRKRFPTSPRGGEVKQAPAKESPNAR